VPASTLVISSLRAGLYQTAVQGASQAALLAETCVLRPTSLIIDWPRTLIVVNAVRPMLSVVLLHSHKS
jgi:hypothetical protein